MFSALIGAVRYFSFSSVLYIGYPPTHWYVLTIASGCTEHSIKIGAKFIRTDSTGTITGVEAITDHDGNAVFNNVPFAPTDSTEIYYKQITSDGGHTFDDSVKSIIMTTSTQTVEIANPAAPLRNIMLTDASFPNIPIKDGQIILEDYQ